MYLRFLFFPDLDILIGGTVYRRSLTYLNICVGYDGHYGGHFLKTIAITTSEHETTSVDAFTLC